MAGRKRPHVYIRGYGWASKKEAANRDYEEYKDESWAFLISVWRWYPDLLCDILRSPDAKYQNEELIQRVMMRAFARYQYVDITGCRSLTKTSTKMKQMLISNILWPNTKTSYYGPSYKQQAELANAAFSDIKDDYPLLANHYSVEAAGKDNWVVSTTYGSSITINAIRGKNIHNVTAEEYAQEENPPFDFDEYTTVVLYAVRLMHMVQGQRDPTYIPYQQHSITSAGRKQNHAYETRCKHMISMRRGQSAFVMDVPWQVIVLSQMRPYQWAEQRRAESTPEKWMREMESHYTGADENPIVRDAVLSECRSLTLMEEHHCCNDRDNQLGPRNVMYIVGYDVSYEDNKNNAKCACVVVKLTRQRDKYRANRFLKEVVYVDDWPPPPTAIMQAQKLKSVWYRYCFEGGTPTYIAIDGWQYGKSVIESLMLDLEDGLPPLCIIDHSSYTDLELEDALPVIYPIKAGGVGVTDPDSEMIRNAEREFEAKNVVLLTANRGLGLETYKRYHSVKDDYSDVQIDRPYRKTTELIGQIQNLKKVASGAGVAEKRISNAIQRDSWSALKYALRLAQRLEYQILMRREQKSEWEAVVNNEQEHRASRLSRVMESRSRMIVPRQGGRLY